MASPVLGVEEVVLVDAHPRQITPLTGHLVVQPGHLFFGLEQVRPGGKPLLPGSCRGGSVMGQSSRHPTHMFPVDPGVNPTVATRVDDGPWMAGISAHSSCRDRRRRPTRRWPGGRGSGPTPRCGRPTAPSGSPRCTRRTLVLSPSGIRVISTSVEPAGMGWSGSSHPKVNTTLVFGHHLHELAHTRDASLGPAPGRRRRPGDRARPRCPSIGRGGPDRSGRGRWWPGWHPSPSPASVQPWLVPFSRSADSARSCRRSRLPVQYSSRNSSEPVHLSVVGPVQAAGAVSALDHQLRLAQDTEVLGDGRAGDIVEPGGDLGRRQLLGPHQPEDLPPPGFGQSLERGVHGSNISLYLRKCQLTDRTGPATRPHQGAGSEVIQPGDRGWDGSTVTTRARAAEQVPWRQRRWRTGS